MKLFLNNKEKNILSSFLDYLDVKHTKEYTNKLYNEHPHKYNLFGLSRMLSSYNIENAGVKVQNKQAAIKELETPFIAHIGSDFVVVYKITIDRVYYIWNKKDLSITIDEFCEIWSGIILYAESDENSVEPEYKSNYKTQIFKQLQKKGLWTAIFFVLAIAFIRNNLGKGIEYYLLTTVNIAGIYISYLLVLKQIHIHSEYGDKICSLFSQSDCNNILESDAAKLGGVVGWSEIGLGYFIGNIVITAYFPNLIPYMVLINILALPYSFWSIWYQKFKAKQWCPLCLIVQCLLGITFFLNLGFGLIQFPEISISDTLLTILLYLIPILLINTLIPNLGQNKKMEQITQELNSIKTDENVFSAILKKQPFYEVDKSTSSILWGNTGADILVTILTNPHCNPCAKMHKRIEKMLDESSNLCIQYIFSSFGEELNISNKFLSAIYFEKEIKERRKIYRRWFEEKNLKNEEIFEIYNVNKESDIVRKEFQKHENWKKATGIRPATPTILVNGYKLPDNYKIEDLKYFTTLDL